MASDDECKSTVSSMGHHSKHPHDDDVEFYLPKVPLTLQILKRLCSEEDPADATKIKIELDINRNSVQNIGHLLPRLQELNITNSIIHTLRDLGTGLRHLRTLWICHCNLPDLDGLTSLGALRELYASYNLITDVSPCTMLDYLEVLDLEGNALTDVSNLGFLRLCRHLNSLTLVENPLWSDSQGETYSYRLAVQEEVPQLKFLDGVPLAPKHLKGMRSNVTRRTHSLDMTADIDNDTKHRRNVPSFSGFSHGDGAMSRHHSIHEMPTPPPALVLANLAAHSGSAGRQPSEDAQAASDLTRGEVVCGNTARALRRTLFRRPVAAISERRASEADSQALVLDLLSGFQSLTIDSNKQQTDDEEENEALWTEMTASLEEEKKDKMKPEMNASPIFKMDVEDMSSHDDDDGGNDVSVESTDSGVSLDINSLESADRSDGSGVNEPQHVLPTPHFHARKPPPSMIKDGAAKVMGNFMRRYSEPLHGSFPDAFPKPMRRDVLDMDEEEF